jgi:hypothetical protein
VIIFVHPFHKSEQKALTVPNMFSLPLSIFDWNQIDDEFHVSIFDFTSTHVHDDGFLLLFFSNDPKLKTTLKGYMVTYNLSVFKEWMEVN